MKELFDDLKIVTRDTVLHSWSNALELDSGALRCSVSKVKPGFYRTLSQ